MADEIYMKERCVICDKETNYDIETHIDQRHCYVEGAGQLCSECYKRVYDHS
jgi:hypothetical protein